MKEKGGALDTDNGNAFPHIEHVELPASRYHGGKVLAGRNKEPDSQLDNRNM